MNKSRDHYEGALLEEFREQMKFVIEALKALKDVPADVRRLKEDMIVVKSDLKVMKAVLIDQSKTLNSHETRLTKLEVA